MRDGAEQIGPHFFFFGIHQQLFPLNQSIRLSFDPSGHGAHHQGDDQGKHKGHRVSGEGKVYLKIWISKQIIDAGHAYKGSGNPVEIPLGETGGKYQGGDIYQRDIGGIFRDRFKKPKGNHSGNDQNQHRKKKVPDTKGKSFFHF